MLTCITCSKQRTEDGDGTPRANDAVKSLTTQIKDMALKASGGSSSKYANPRGSFRLAHPPDAISEGFPADHPYIPRFSTTSSRFGDVTLEEDDEPKEWIAQVEPGVQITFVSLPRGGNDLKRIRFSREMFDKFQAQRWWGENFDRITELYNVQKFNQQALNTPGRSEDGRDSIYSRLGLGFASAIESPRVGPRYSHYYNGAGPSGGPSGGPRGTEMEASRTTTSSASVSMSNASDIDSEWIEEDEPGVYITIRQLMDGTRELRRVRFSREKFGEVHAKNWWEANRDRIQAQYLS